MLNYNTIISVHIDLYYLLEWQITIVADIHFNKGIFWL